MLLNAWPLDEAYIDSTVVGGSPERPGVLQRIDEFPNIDAQLLVGLNQVGGEENVATGWHAIEFLLWGQDLDPNGPGNRPLSDWTTDRWAERRRDYLLACSTLLVEQLEELVAAWDPVAEEDNYRAEFLALDVEQALIKMLTGVGELARGELAGERMTVAYEERSQEEEHSCFSDNTHADLISNLQGIEAVLVETGFLDLVAESELQLASRLKTRLDLSATRLAAIPPPFDQHLDLALADSDPGRTAILAAIESLEDLTEVLVSAASAAGLRISVS
jgi:putative iron-regulated protein